MAVSPLPVTACCFAPYSLLLSLLAVSCVLVHCGHWGRTLCVSCLAVCEHYALYVFMFSSLQLARE